MACARHAPGGMRQATPHIGENVRVHSADFFEDLAPSPYGLTTQPAVLSVDLLQRLTREPLPDATDMSAAEGLFDLVEHELIAYGTGGSDLTEQQSIVIIRALEAVTKRLGIQINLPFRSFSTFRSYWIRQGASGSGGWDARRVIIADLFEPTRARFEALSNDEGPQLAEDVVANLRDPAAIRENLRRLQGIIDTDPALAIGTAKELVESTAKTVLQERGRQIDDKADLPSLVNQAQESLGLHPKTASIGPDEPKR